MQPAPPPARLANLLEERTAYLGGIPEEHPRIGRKIASPVQGVPHIAHRTSFRLPSYSTSWTVILPTSVAGRAATGY